MSLITSPPPGVNTDVTDNTPFEALSEKSLKAAGIAYLVGDAGLFASGILKGQYKEASAGLLWGLGGFTCARYGNPTAEEQLKLLSADVGDYLRKQNITIPKTPNTQALTKTGGVIDGIESFLYTYPSQLLNATYAVGGVQLLRSGMQHHAPWTSASGALVTAGALAGLLIEEKKPDPDHPPQTTFAKAKAWIHEKPLRVSGGLYALNNISLIISAFSEKRAFPNNASYLFKFLTAGSYIFANAMLSISSKGHGNSSAENNAVMEQLATRCSTVINAQPPQLRDALIEHIAVYLSAKPSVHMPAADISAMLHAKMNATSKTDAPQQDSYWTRRIENSSTPPTLSL